MRIHALWERLVFGQPLPPDEVSEIEATRKGHESACHALDVESERTQEIALDVFKRASELSRDS